MAEETPYLNNPFFIAHRPESGLYGLSDNFAQIINPPSYLQLDKKTGLIAQVKQQKRKEILKDPTQLEKIKLAETAYHYSIKKAKAIDQLGKNRICCLVFSRQYSLILFVSIVYVFQVAGLLTAGRFAQPLQKLSTTQKPHPA